MTKKPNYVFDTDDVLCHHGIPNQRWGHRRFQNEDGSLTPEGRERYGVDKARSKADAQKAKARISYNTQKYKADLKSKARKDADTRHAKEERNRVKEWSKTERLAKKEEARINSKSNSDIQSVFKSKKPKNMSDDELRSAIERLKLQSEYNKQYVLATQPNSALAKADRFFGSETGKAAVDVVKAVLPNAANTAVQQVLQSALKYSNKEDRDERKYENEAKKIANKNATMSNQIQALEVKKAQREYEKLTGADFDGDKINFSKEDFIQPKKKKKK